MPPPPIAANKEVLPAPPWQLWQGDPRAEPAFGEAERFLEQGNLPEAVNRYRQAEISAPAGSRLREEAFARRMAVELRRGQGKPVLDEISRWVRQEGRSLNDVGPQLGMVIAFSYVYLHDWNQVYAWLSLVNRQVGGKGIFARRALSTGGRLASSLTEGDLSAAADKWQPDAFVGPILNSEKLRRSKGGRQDLDAFAGWLPKEAYAGEVPWENRAGNDLQGSAPVSPVAGGAVPMGELPPAALEVPSQDGALVLGAILPVTGKFASHARYVEQGIRLAVEEYLSKPNPVPVRLVVGDSAGDGATAAREYERLVRDERALMVLGPLLVKSAEEVAARSDQLGVPFLTFTKKPNITELSRVAFRLGATADNQIDELLSYASSELGSHKLCTLFPRDTSGQEFAEALRKSAKASGALVAEASYTPSDTDSMEASVRELDQKGCDATFIPDELEDLQPVLQARSRSGVKGSTLLGPALWNDPVAVRGFGPLLDGAVYVTPYYQGSPRPQVVDFVAKYRAHYQTEPELLAAQAYDGTQFVLRALEKATSERRPLIELLKSAEPMEGVTGKLTMTGDREISRRMSVLRITNGEILEVMTGGNVTAFLPSSGQPGSN